MYEQLKQALISADLAAQQISIDKTCGIEYLIVDEVIFVDMWQDEDEGICGRVTYEVDDTVALPICHGIEAIVQDVLRAQDHVWAVNEAMKNNGGELPVGWCY